MLSLNYESINHVMTQILKLSCASFSYVNISYVLAVGHRLCKMQLRREFDPILACLNCLHMLCMPDSCGMFVEETKNNRL